MSGERWARIEALFHAALERPPAERSRFLAEACGGDDELRREIESLLASDDSTATMNGGVLPSGLRSDALRVMAARPRAPAAAGRFVPGDTLMGRFKLVRSLGRGGMGEVYEATDVESGGVVALKTIRSGIEDDAAALYRFKQEFRALADLRHPNLVQLYEMHSDGHVWFFTMELVRGSTFLRHTRPGASADLERLRSALGQLAGALDALHGANKLHRDLKPTNVLVTDEQSLRVIDFGLISDQWSGESSGVWQRAGTPQYMSPEQLAESPLTAASDWYSVGVMLYEALTGRLPFSGSVAEVAEKKRTCDPPPVPEAGELSALCADLLRRDPDERPRSERVLSRLRRAPEVRPERRLPAMHEGPLIGRAAEIDALHRACRETRRGRPILVCLSGGSGVGKTSVIRDFLRGVQAADPAAVVLEGRCYERESVPFNAVDGLVDALSTRLSTLPPAAADSLLPRDALAIAKLFPVLGQVEAIAARPAMAHLTDAIEMRRRAATALRELLARLAAAWTLVIAIDDVQWADADSFLLLSDVLGHPEAPPSLVILAHRDDADLMGLDALLSQLPAGGVRHLMLTALSREESTALAAQRLRDAGAPPSFLPAIVEEARGIPLFIDQLSHFVATVPAAESLEDARPRLDFATVTAERVRSLPPPALALLELVAVAGQPLQADQVVHAAGVDIYEALPSLRVEKLITTRARRRQMELEPYHDRIRQAVLATLPPDRRRSRHRELAFALEKSSHADPEVVARHFEAAGIREKAATHAERAAERAAAALAFDRAASLYEDVLRLSAGGGRERAVLLVRVADALANAGRGPEAAGRYLEASAGHRGVEGLRLEQRAGEELLRSGHLDEGMRHLGRVATAVGVRLAGTTGKLIPSMLLRRAQVWLRGVRSLPREAAATDPRTLLRIDVCWSVAVGWSFIDTLRGAEAQALHLLLALRAGEPMRVALGLAAEAGYAIGRGKLRSVPRLLELALTAADRAGSPRAQAGVIFARGILEWARGDFARAHALFARAEDVLLTRCRGVAWELDSTRIFGAASLAWMGRLAELGARLPPLVQEARRRGDRYGAASLLLLTRSWLLPLAADDPDAAERDVTEAMSRWPTSGFHLQHFWALLARFETALYRGEPQLAAQLARRQWSALARSLLVTNPIARLFAGYLRAACALAEVRAAHGRPGDRERSLREAEREAARIARLPLACSTAFSGLVRARAADLRQQPETAIERYGVAAPALEAAHLRIHAAVARRRLGELTGGDEGRRLVAGADSVLGSEGVKSPGRFASIF